MTRLYLVKFWSLWVQIGGSCCHRRQVVVFDTLFYACVLNLKKWYRPKAVVLSRWSYFGRGCPTKFDYIFFWICKAHINFLPFVSMITCNVLLLLKIYIIQLFNQTVNYIKGPSHILDGLMVSLFLLLKLNDLFSKTFKMILQNMNICNIIFVGLVWLFREGQKTSISIFLSWLFICVPYHHDIISPFLFLDPLYHTTISLLCHSTIPLSYHLTIETISPFYKLTSINYLLLFVSHLHSLPILLVCQIQL